MEERTFRRRRLAGLLAAAAIIAAACCERRERKPGRHRGECPAGNQRRTGAQRRRRAGGFACENIGGEVSVYGTWTGAEQDSFLAMVAPLEEADRHQDQLHGHARPRHRSSRPASPAATCPTSPACPAPARWQTWATQGALKPLDFVDFAAYEAATPAGFADLGKAPTASSSGIFTKAAVKGLIWYNTKVLDGRRARRLGRAQHHRARRGDRRPKHVVHRPRVRRRLRLARHGLDRGHRPPPGRPRHLRPVAAGELKWTSPEIKAAFETFGDAVANAYGGAELHRRHQLRQGREPDVHRLRPAACSTTRPASSPASSRTRRGASRRRLRLLPCPTSTRRTRAHHRRRRPVRDVQRHAPGTRADPVAADPPGPADLGERRRLHLGQQVRRRRCYPDEASRVGRDLVNAADVPLRRRRPHADARCTGVLQAMVEFAQNPGNLDSILANLDTVQADAYTSRLATPPSGGRRCRPPSRTRREDGRARWHSEPPARRGSRPHRLPVLMVGYILLVEWILRRVPRRVRRPPPAVAVAVPGARCSSASSWSTRRSPRSSAASSTGAATSSSASTTTRGSSPRPTR